MDETTAAVYEMAVYEIEVSGALSEAVMGAFPALTGRTTGGGTVLSGYLPDQSALHGVLTQIESLRLELVAVRRVR